MEVANQEKRTFVSQVTRPVWRKLPPVPVSVRVNYLLFQPEGYEAQKQESWPLIVFLHGVGERGDMFAELDKLRVNGIPKVVEEDPSFPFIAVSPQCPQGLYWNFLIEPLDKLLDWVVENFAVDESRIYLTGLSMGGYGTWHWAAERPDRFAAIAPIAGGYHPSSANGPEVCVLKDLPIWAFHGAKDDIVLPEESINVVEQLKACGGNVRFTLYPQAGHDSWTITYANSELYQWFLKHQR